MFLAKMKVLAAAVLGVTAVVAGALFHPPLAAEQPAPRPADRPAAPTPRQAQQELQGPWEVVAVELEGERVPGEALKGSLKVVIAGDKLRFEAQGLLPRLMLRMYSPKLPASTFRLDAGKKPRTIDLTSAGNTEEGIYRLEGDTLTICFGGKKRPTDFTTRRDEDSVCLVLKRGAPADGTGRLKNKPR